METKKINFSRVSGIIIIVCAIAIMIFNYFVKDNLDSFIMPFILLFVGTVFLLQKQTQERKRINLSSTAGKVILSVSIFVLISGIVAFFLAI